MNDALRAVDKAMDAVDLAGHGLPPGEYRTFLDELISTLEIRVSDLEQEGARHSIEGNDDGEALYNDGGT